MSLRERIIELRKKRGISQAELARQSGVHTNVLGRYERGEAKTYVDTAAKIAKVLNISLDYLVGNTDDELDEQMLQRVSTISQLPEEEKEKILMVVDALLRDFKARKVFV